MGLFFLSYITSQWQFPSPLPFSVLPSTSHLPRSTSPISLQKKKKRAGLPEIPTEHSIISYNKTRAETLILSTPWFLVGFLVGYCMAKIIQRHRGLLYCAKIGLIQWEWPYLHFIVVILIWLVCIYVYMHMWAHACGRLKSLLNVFSHSPPEPGTL